MARTRYENYSNALGEDAQLFVDEYLDSFLEEIKGGGWQDFYDFVDGDSRLHEHVDQDLSLQEAVDILENCEFEETDSGIWEGLKPVEAIKSMAFWSYKHEVYNEIKELFEDALDEELHKQNQKLEQYQDEHAELEDLLETVDEDVEIDRHERLNNRLEKLDEKIDELSNYVFELEKTIEHM